MNISPIYKGYIQWNGNVCVYEGEWAMSEEKYQANDRSSFSYSCKAPSSETDKRKPISGVYSGFFFMKTLTDPVRVAEKSVNLKFSIPKPQTDQATAPASNIFKVEGHGRNAYGSFKLSGEYTDQGEGKGGSMILMKQYVLSATTPKARSRSKKKTPASSARKKTLKNYVSPHITSYRRSKTGKKTQLMYLKGEIIRPAEGAPASFTIAGKWAMTKKDFEGGIVSDFRYVSHPNSRTVAYQSLDADQSKMTKGSPAAPGPSSGAKSEMPSAKKISEILEEDDASMSSLISEEYRPLMKQMTGLYDGHFCMMAQDGKIEKYEEQGLFFRFHKEQNVIPGGPHNARAAPVHSQSHCTVSVRGTNSIWGKYEMVGSLDFGTGAIELSKYYVPKPAPKTKKTPRPTKTPVTQKTTNGNVSGSGSSTGSVRRPKRVRKAPSKMLAIQEEEIELNRILSGPMLKCGQILRQVMRKPMAVIFNTPVDPVALNLPDYFTVVKHPMDLGKIMKKLRNKEYATPEDFKKDVDLVWSNSFLYNKVGSYVHTATTTIMGIFEKKYDVLAKKLEAQRAEEEKIRAEKEARKAARARPKSDRKRSAKKRKRTPRSGSRKRPSETHPYDLSGGQKVGTEAQEIAMLRQQMQQMQEMIRSFATGGNGGGGAVATPAAAPVKKKRTVKKKGPKPLTFDEKRMLSIHINELPGQKLTRVLQIIKESMPISTQGSSDEIEIDIDAMPTPTLRRLQKYVRGVLGAKKRDDKRSLMEQASKVSEKAASELEQLQRRRNDIEARNDDADDIGGGMIDSSDDESSSSGEEEEIASSSNNPYSTF